MSTSRFLGIFVNPLYVQNEGLRQVFDNLERAGAHAISITPHVSRPASEAGKGRRYPDLHMDGYERLVARPAWGRRVLQLENFLAYEPDTNRYASGPYQPAPPAPPGLDRTVPQAMVAEGKRRGLAVHVQIHPFVPRDVRPDEQPVTINGARPQAPQIALNTCLNNPIAQAYAMALVEDTLTHFIGVDGLFTDWAEFGAYRLQDHFACFCPHCERAATEQGIDWQAVRRDVRALWDWLHALDSRALERARRMLHHPSELVELLAQHPGWTAFLRFKAQTVTRFYRRVRELMDRLDLEGVTLSARGWPPPWNMSSGMDYDALAEICDAVTPKLFTFDYSAIPRWYGQTLLEWNPELSESEILDALVAWMNLPDDIERRSFAHYHIPAPGERHPTRIDAYRPRLDEVVDQVGGRARVYPFAHAYLPTAQWKRMLALISDSRVDGVWVQMYGYLSDEKLAVLRAMWG